MMAPGLSSPVRITPSIGNTGDMAEDPRKKGHRHTIIFTEGESLFTLYYVPFREKAL